MGMLYRMKRAPGISINAHQWHRNGDHPEDRCETFTGSDGKPLQGEGHAVRYFRDPSVLGDSPCMHCGERMHDHGFIDQRDPGPDEGKVETTVCPGAYVIDLPIGRRYALPADIFQREYEPIR